MTVSVVAIIPARLASSRFPGKILARQTGKYLIQHVYEQVRRASRVDEVIIAADDERTITAGREFGALVEYTLPELPSGTDRVAAVAMQRSEDIVINVQGDEPELQPEVIDMLVDAMDRRETTQMATVGCPFPEHLDPTNPNNVKVVVDAGGRALYFSRSLIPYPRDTGGVCDASSRPLLHLGMYGYRRDFLLEFAKWPTCELERIERLEQLRALYHGVEISVVVANHHSQGVDTPEQYDDFVQRYMQAQRNTAT